tara:strand:+ start:23434 stop:23955 length:522 start_codon:yes stop_codon:yes gene_type:complete
MADRRSIQPFLPSAPSEYRKEHQNEVQRSLDTLYGMLLNPGELRGTDLTLTNLQSGNDTDLAIGALFQIDSIVHIAPWNSAPTPPNKPYLAKTANYTFVAADYLVECTANTFTITLPTAVGITGKEYVIKNSGTGIITADADGTETIDDSLTWDLSQYDALKIMSNGANWIIV